MLATLYGRAPRPFDDALREASTTFPAEAIPEGMNSAETGCHPKRPIRIDGDPGPPPMDHRRIVGRTVPARRPYPLRPNRQGDVTNWLLRPNWPGQGNSLRSCTGIPAQMFSALVLSMFPHGAFAIGNRLGVRAVPA